MSLAHGALGLQCVIVICPGHTFEHSDGFVDNLIPDTVTGLPICMHLKEKQFVDI